MLNNEGVQNNFPMEKCIKLFRNLIFLCFLWEFSRKFFKIGYKINIFFYVFNNKIITEFFRKKLHKTNKKLEWLKEKLFFSNLI